MTEEDSYFKGTEGLRRLRDQCEINDHLLRGIAEITLYKDKEMKHLDPKYRVEITRALLLFDEIYWMAFHKFIDKVHAYKKFMA